MGLFDFFKKKPKPSTQQELVTPSPGMNMLPSKLNIHHTQESQALSLQSSTLKNLNSLIIPVDQSSFNQIVPETNINPIIHPFEDALPAPFAITPIPSVALQERGYSDLNPSDTMTMNDHVFVDISKVKLVKNDINMRGVEPILIPSLLENMVILRYYIQNRANYSIDEIRSYFNQYLEINPFDLDTKITYVYYLFEIGLTEDGWNYFYAEVLSKYPQNTFVLEHAVEICVGFGDYLTSLSYLNQLLEFIPQEYQSYWINQKILYLQSAITNNQGYLEEEKLRDLQQELSLLTTNKSQYHE